MLRPSPNHGTQRLPNDDDDDISSFFIVDYLHQELQCMASFFIVDYLHQELQCMAYMSSIT